MDRMQGLPPSLRGGLSVSLLENKLAVSEMRIVVTALDLEDGNLDAATLDGLKHTIEGLSMASVVVQDCLISVCDAPDPSAGGVADDAGNYRTLIAKARCCLNQAGRTCAALVRPFESLVFTNANPVKHWRDRRIGHPCTRKGFAYLSSSKDDRIVRPEDRQSAYDSRVQSFLSDDGNPDDIINVSRSQDA